MNQLRSIDFDLIKRFVSHPGGNGYVANFSNRSFSVWFRDIWNVDIDDPSFEDEGTSKGNRLVSFCRKADQATVLRVLNSLRQIAYDLEIEKSEKVTVRDLKAFDSLLERLDHNAPEKSEETVFGKVTRSQLLSNAKTNQVSLILVGASALESLANFREVVRSDNFLAVEEADT